VSYLADLDLDGDLDLVVMGDDGTMSNRFDRYLNDGNGTLNGPVSIGQGGNDGSLNAADIDGDGDLDLIRSGQIPNSSSPSMSNIARAAICISTPPEVVVKLA